jgi:4'-phosphopantetheinyl transferase EntD
MTWRELPPLTTDVAAQLPDLEQVVLVAGRIGDHTAELWPEERDAIARARSKRAHEYSTGRLLARRAMAELGLEAAAIARAEDRSPVWPDIVRGSITHAGDVAVAAVTRAETLRGIGIDLERTERVAEKLFSRIFTPVERASLEGADPRLPGVLFSAKEAGFKAVSPRVGRYIAFHEAETEVSWTDRTVRFRYVGKHEPNRIMEAGVGHFCFFERYVLTVFIIP